MNSSRLDPRIDRLYHLLPAIYRIRDAERGYSLQALLRVITEQANIVEDDIAQLYENWFIETTDDWVVPYIADLIGYRPIAEAGRPGSDRTPESAALNRALIPRREVANTIRYRRRKGTVALLEELANDVADWPARVVEFYRLMNWRQNLNHPHLDRARTVDIRGVSALDLLGTAFDSIAHTSDARRIASNRTTGDFNIRSVGVYLWRLKPYSVTHCPAYCAESAGPHCNSFSVLGNDAPLFTNPLREATDYDIAGELQVPGPIRRRALEENKSAYYGLGKSLAIWAEDWAGYDSDAPIPAEAIVAADLTDWQYAPGSRKIAVDPVLGRFSFPPGQLPRKGVRVTYHYGFSADMGGGEYRRAIADPSPRADTEGGEPEPVETYRVGRQQAYARINDALQAWKKAAPRVAVIELTDTGVYVEPIYVELGRDQTLHLRAANRVRPVIRLLDWQTDLPDAMAFTMDRGSRIVLDGLLITGRAVHFRGPSREEQDPPSVCSSHIVIRHCTLVPGWGINSHCQPKRPAEPSLELYGIRAEVRIENSIVGSIQIHEDEVKTDPILLRISDSIIDATQPKKEAIGSPGYAVAHVVLTVRRTTFFGIVDVHAIELAEDTIFMNCLNVARRQIGCMRFCFVPNGCRTPKRYRCQPDMAVEAAKLAHPDPAQSASAVVNEQLRVRPQFTSSLYGNPGYGQLAHTCAPEITRGAEDESEMGAFHNLFQPQREANLRGRLDEFTPAEMETGMVFVT